MIGRVDIEIRELASEALHSRAGRQHRAAHPIERGNEIIDGCHQRRACGRCRDRRRARPVQPAGPAHLLGAFGQLVGEGPEATPGRLKGGGLPLAQALEGDHERALGSDGGRAAAA
ncbi:MAG: hypothetical protein V9F04_07310 [Dermatophilaceae bacterium]